VTNLAMDAMECMQATIELQKYLIDEMELKLEGKRQQVERLLALAEKQQAVIESLRDRK
jgi:hypothetical protein